MKISRNNNVPKYLTCERRIVYELLMMSAGMMGAYTFNLRGGVFCNAQTANCVMMAIAFGRGNWRDGVYFFIPITAYLAGAFLSEFIPKPIKKVKFLRWDTYLIGIEIIVLFIIGYIPLDVPDQVVQVTINFICSMQYNTFRQAEGIPMATTFCTNHVRQIGICGAKYIRTKDCSIIRRGVIHIKMIMYFVGGGVLLSVFCDFLREKTIWLAIIPLLINFFILLYADLFKEHDFLDKVPSGH